MRFIVYGFACCVLAMGARAQWSGYSYPPAWNPNVAVVYQRPPQSQPVVVILDARPGPVPVDQEYAPARQITYLIAFKDSVVRAADQYWVSGCTLYYLTPDHQRRTASVNSVDRTLSELLNSEQNVAFDLPAAQEGSTEVRPCHVRHTSRLVRKRQPCAARAAR